jgi:hypothetical protein
MKRAVIAALWLAACGGRGEGTAPTYGADIAPMLNRSCAPCHSGADPSLPDLSNVTGARANALAALAAVRAGRMPLSNIDKSGSCQTFQGPAPLTAAEQDLLSEWTSSGMDEGPAAVPWQAPSLSGAIEASLPEPYTPRPSDAEPLDDHRCFLVDAALAHDTWLTGFEVEPGVPALVHHVLLFSTTSDADVAAARALDSADPLPGWACFGSPGIDGATLAAAWTPGQRVVELPSGSGVALPARPLIVQLHYRVGDGTQSDQTRFRFRLADTVTQPLRFVPVAAPDFALPPGAPDYRYQQQVPLSFDPHATLLGVFPHMHLLGTSLHLSSQDTCIVDAPRWSYGHQELALYREPFQLGAGAQLTLTCTWDTVGRTSVTTWGETTSDEMCMAFLLLAQ